MKLNEYPPEIVRGMIYYANKDVTIKSSDINIAIPKYTLLEIKRKAVVSGYGHKGVEYYVVYFKQSTGAIADTSINRRDINFYSLSIKGLWDDYGRYKQDLQNKLLLQSD